MMNHIRKVLSRACLMVSGAMILSGATWLIRLHDPATGIFLFVMSLVAVGASAAFERQIEPEGPYSQIRLIRRDYFTPAHKRDHASYVGMLFRHDGKVIDTHNLLTGRWIDGKPVKGLFDLAEVGDGDEVEITFRKTGRRPFGDRRVILQRANYYGAETDAQMAFRREHGRIWNYKQDPPVDQGEAA